MHLQTSIKKPAKKITTPNKRSGDIVIYQNSLGNIKLDVYLENETVWLNQEQMGVLFNKAKSTINEHIQNIYKEKELVLKKTMRKIGISEFSTKPTNYYNLDVIISVGYRVKSKQGTQFRIWATNRQTASEIVYKRADANLPLMGMQSWSNKKK